MSEKDRETSEPEIRQTSPVWILPWIFRHRSVGHLAEFFPFDPESSQIKSDLINNWLLTKSTFEETAEALTQLLSVKPTRDPSEGLVLPGDSSHDRVPLSVEDAPEALRQEIEDLRIRNERLRSLVAQERRLATRETQRNDRLLSQLEVQEMSLQRMAETLGDMAKANNTLQRALIADKEGQLRMFESHEGVVMHVDDDSVVVTYSIGGDYVDQTYRKDQFIGGRLPQKGDRLAVYVHVAALPKERPDKETSARSPDDQRTYRKHAVRPPREF